MVLQARLGAASAGRRKTCALAAGRSETGARSSRTARPHSARRASSRRHGHERPSFNFHDRSSSDTCRGAVVPIPLDGHRGPSAWKRSSIIKGLLILFLKDRMDDPWCQRGAAQRIGEADLGPEDPAGRKRQGHFALPHLGLCFDRDAIPCAWARRRPYHSPRRPTNAVRMDDDPCHPSRKRPRCGRSWRSRRRNSMTPRTASSCAKAFMRPLRCWWRR